MHAIDTITELPLRIPVPVLIAALAACLIIVILYRGYNHRRFYRDLPGPPHSWLFGHIKVFSQVAALMPSNTHPQLLYTEMVHVYNLEEIFYLDLWPVGPGMVVITDPKLLDNSSLPKPLPIHPFTAVFLKPMFGEGTMAATNGALWKKMATAVSPAFSMGYVLGITNIMVDECLLFQEKLEELAVGGDVFSMEELVAKLVFGIVSTVTFGEPQYSQTIGSQILKDLRDLVNLAQGETDPLIAYNPMVQIPRRWKRHRVVSRLDSSLRQKVSECVERIVHEGVVPSRQNPRSIMDLLVREHAEAVLEERKGGVYNRSWLSNSEEEMLFSNLKTMLLGGHTTSTNTLCFLFMLLSKTPDVVEKMHQEHIEQLGTSPQVTLLANPSMFRRLPYTEAVVKESLRLYPLGSDLKQAPPGTTITTHDGRRLPIANGLIMTASAHTIHYDAHIYPDPASFRPERWLNQEKPIPGDYFRAFGGDGRTCPGQNMGMNILKIVMVMTMTYQF
ncbi:cytochrome P450 monooxygenase [Fusarium mundagurra]|uniref:Cytochrome P450 monooxygenase n=1 Tax=Fusarium mundagurra TaxID=1567541 RepID=A0A8H5Z1P7_9HYPO|nr:cytochrome P450 monooxygenase [Fusarium mundagurra]